jgi:Bacterial Ig-like domain
MCIVRTFQLGLTRLHGKPTTKIVATVSCNADTNTAKLDPTNLLKRGATYKAVVTTGTKDVIGNLPDQNSFATGL